MDNNSQTSIEKSRVSVSFAFVITFIVTLIFTSIVTNICIEKYLSTLTSPGLFGMTRLSNFTDYMYLYAGLPSLALSFFFVSKYIIYSGKLTKQYFRSLKMGYSISYVFALIPYLNYGPNNGAMIDMYAVIFFIGGAIITSVLNVIFYSKNQQ